MKRLLVALLGTALAAAGPAAAGPTAGGIASDNIEYVKHVPLVQSGVGGHLIGKHFYLNDTDKVMIFDVTDPVDPELIGYVLMPQEAELGREDLDGNGRILLVPSSVSGMNDGTPPEGDPENIRNAVYVVDVRDKANPRIIGKVGVPLVHTVTCVLDCRWAWLDEGYIIDLKNPAQPRLVPEKWGATSPWGNIGHDVEEVAPGLVVTATQPLQLFDARHDPLHPTLRAIAPGSEDAYMHGTRWPRKTKDRFLLAASETIRPGRCGADSGSFSTWDASAWKRVHAFTMIDEYRVGNGTGTDGDPPANFHCSAHWFDEHPDFRNGGLVAAAFYDHGTRFLNVTSKGVIEEEGYFYAYGGIASAAYWITDEVVYSVDYARGLDILRFHPTG